MSCKSSEKKTDDLIETELLVEAIYRKYGYDFRNYGKAHLLRRVRHRLERSKFKNVSEMIHAVIYDQNFYHQILSDLSINVTEMFRDPKFYQAVRKEVVPLLKTYPFIKIWHAGCSSGEEVYSMAILLEEEGLLDKTQIYATDFNPVILKHAKEGIYPVSNIKDYTKNYQNAGGKHSFSDYYDANYDSVKLSDRLKKNIVFADHNLVTDSVFGEMNMIVCRNVLIYFNKHLQAKVVKLFLESLTKGGYLCLGSKENIRGNKHEKSFEPIVSGEKIYAKKY